MINIDALKKSLIAHEGFRKKVYKDSKGILTIGVGRNIESKGLSRDEVLFLLDNDIAEVVSEMEKEPYYMAIRGDDVRCRVIIEMAFNLGEAGLEEFKKMLAAVQSFHFEIASEEMLNSKWARQVGDRAKILAQMMKTGVDISE